MNEDVEFLIMCKHCNRAHALAQNESSKESPTSTLALHGRECHNLLTVPKGGRPPCNNQPLASVRTHDTRSELKQASSDSSLASKSRHRLCSWGVIWKKKKKNSEDTVKSGKSGIDFRLKNVLLKGSFDIHRLEPVCHLCHKPYRSDLMYICCEACNSKFALDYMFCIFFTENSSLSLSPLFFFDALYLWSLAEWYHAEAVELEESKIFDVVGFKCCRCRRIKSPVCPYTDLKDKLPEGRRTRTKDIKQGHIPVDSDFGIISEFREWEPATVFHMEEVSNQESKESEPATPVFSMGQVLKLESVDCESGTLFPMEEVSKQENDPLLFPLTKVELLTEHNSELDIEQNTASGPWPQKLPVRRHVKREGDVDGVAESNLFHAELSTHLETNNFLEPTEKASPPQAEWDVQSEMMLDYEGFNYEDMEFEPQTYFTVTELLASDDVGSFGGVDDPSGDWSRCMENPSSTISQDEVPEPYKVLDTSNDQLEPANSVKPCVHMIHCQRCSQTEPAPDLSCYICGLQIHRNCSPWDESSFGAESWSCGDCREWR